MKRRRFIRKLEREDEKSLYVFCLDNSGSVQVDYNIEGGAKEAPKYDLSDLKNSVLN